MCKHFMKQFYLGDPIRAATVRTMRQNIYVQKYRYLDKL